MSTIDCNGVELYDAPRDERFVDVLRKTLERGVEEETVAILTSGKNLEVYAQAFTATSADPIKNYEVLELLGDVVANGIIKWYALDRFPQLEKPKGVDILSRVLIKYGAKQSFYKLAENAGFWPYISASVIHRHESMKSLLEDVFEAFCGATMRILRDTYDIGIGYKTVYTILASLMNEVPMSLEYEELRDAKTRLKESFDANKELGILVYTEKKDSIEIDSGTVYISESTAWCIPRECNITQRKIDDARDAKERAIRLEDQETSRNNHGKVGKGGKSGKGGNTEYAYDRLLNQIKEKAERLGSGTAAIKSDAQQRAAAQAIESLKKKDMYKGPPEGYSEIIKPLE